MATPIQNAQFAQSLFAPAANILTGFGQNRVQQEQLGYQDRLRQIKREQDLADAAEKYSQQEAITNLTLKNQRDIAEEQTNRVIRAAEIAAEKALLVEESRDKRNRELAKEDTLEKFKIAYAKAQGTETMPADLKTIDQQINWYAGKVGAREEDMVYQKALPALLERWRNLGSEGEYPHDASAKERHDWLLDHNAIASTKAADAFAQTVDDNVTAFNTLKNKLETNTDKEQLDANTQALSSLSPELREKLKGKNMARAMSTPAGARSTLATKYPAELAQYDAVYNQALEGSRALRNKSEAPMLAQLQDNLAVFAPFLKDPANNMAYQRLLQKRRGSAAPGQPVPTVGGYDITKIPGSTPGALVEPPGAAGAPSGAARQGAITPAQAILDTWRPPGTPDAAPVVDPETGEVVEDGLPFGATPDTPGNINTRRNNAVTDYVLSQAQGLGRRFNPDNWTTAYGGPGSALLRYEPTGENAVADLLKRYNALDDKTSPRAIKIRDRVAQLTNPSMRQSQIPSARTLAGMVPSPGVDLKGGLDDAALNLLQNTSVRGSPLIAAREQQNQADLLKQAALLQGMSGPGPSSRTPNSEFGIPYLNAGASSRRPEDLPGMSQYLLDAPRDAIYNLYAAGERVPDLFQKMGDNTAEGIERERLRKLYELQTLLGNR
jgi:hypothetical protein